MDTPTPAPVANEPKAPDLTPVLDRLEAIEAKLTTPEPAAAPIPPVIEHLGNPAIERVEALRFDPIKKAEFIRAEYAEISKQKRIAAGITLPNKYDPFDLKNPEVMNANTIDAGLTNSLLSADAITTMRTYVAPISAFTRKIELSPMSKRQVVNVPLVSSVGSMQTNPTNFETGDTV